MGTILLIGLLIPVVYLMQLTKKKEAINVKYTRNTVGISIISVVVTTIIFILLNHTNIPIWGTMISAIIVAVVWALLLSGCYYIYQILSNNVKK
ncbi:hypothetical protein [Staphylococcus edaphicus]|uniref:Uncharacterized protein n=1 Tax=Staphylococcus edaphicus TaxID=1955013 RepID=A0A2C6WPG2_9STAP|nr:hypothetical protein [Staphylococcus edaphicus]PHK50970.1 hypothetical protein BTJ66_01335 [Staphylococcus edaphicus]UQW82658.1 hypothetical protein MNY58_06295 [Staphylococcus edaphicus]